ncbi:MAG: carboxylating nicotinate-nucleotide diphosphorylase [Actinobacteria bacterium]|nr:carboxylating nicotinate-nucleotide diphosphorylase [Actinomycetota bacterium]
MDEAAARSEIRRFLAEDVGRGDITTELTVPTGRPGTARIEAREGCVVAGIEVARWCFEELEGDLEWRPEVVDGDELRAPGILTRLSTDLGSILTIERTALNLLGRMSAIATQARRYVAAVAATPARIVDTRKTTPGLRMFERYAVRVGGASNHRFGLDDGILIKDNHIAAAGGVSEAVRRARAGAPHGLKVEVEVTDLAQLDEALSAGADAVLLDNMDVRTTTEAVQQAGGKVLLESSGGITLENVGAYAETGVDLISVGALTHSVRTIDVALELE